MPIDDWVTRNYNSYTSPVSNSFKEVTMSKGSGGNKGGGKGGGKGGNPNWPSKTGKQSGDKRGNNPPTKK